MFLFLNYLQETQANQVTEVRWTHTMSQVGQHKWPLGAPQEMDRNRRKFAIFCDRWKTDTGFLFVLVFSPFFVTYVEKTYLLQVQYGGFSLAQSYEQPYEKSVSPGLLHFMFGIHCKKYREFYRILR